MSNNKGQSMIEVIVALAIAGVVLGALVILILNSLKNSKFAQNQVKATQYAQQGIEQVRNIRDQNMPQSVILFCTNAVIPCPINKFSDLWGYNLSNGSGYPCTATLPGGSNGCYFKLDSTAKILSEPVGATVASFSDTPETGFSRLIEMTDQPNSYSKEKVVTVRVQWNDSDGVHQSNLQTILTPKI